MRHPADGQWHVAVAPVTLREIRTLAVQVQASTDGAWWEIGDLRFVDRQPVIKLADTFESTPGWPVESDGWRTVDLPPGNLSGVDLARRLRVQGWLSEGRLTTAGVPFHVRGGDDAVIMTALRQPGRIRVALSGRWLEAQPRQSLSV